MSIFDRFFGGNQGEEKTFGKAVLIMKFKDSFITIIVLKHELKFYKEIKCCPY